MIRVELTPEVRVSLGCLDGQWHRAAAVSCRRDPARDHYQWTEDGRSILAEEVKNEIYDGATPYSTYVRGVIVDGDRGVLLTGRDERALSIEG